MAQIHMIVRYQDHEMEFKQDIVEQDGYVSARHNYKVPRILWENMEAVLLAQSKKYIEELAKILQVNAKELQKRVMPSADSIKVVLQDVEERQCTAYVQQGTCTVFCRKPIYHGTFCAAHSVKRPLVSMENAATIQRLKDIESLPSTWILNNNLIAANGQQIGRINHTTKKIKIYVIDN